VIPRYRPLHEFHRDGLTDRARFRLMQALARLRDVQHLGRLDKAGLQPVRIPAALRRLHQEKP
jgi:hypothetical protein